MVVCVGGAYHGKRIFGPSESKGVVVVEGEQDRQRYVRFESRKEIHFYRHDSINFRKAIELIPDAMNAVEVVG